MILHYFRLCAPRFCALCFFLTFAVPAFAQEDAGEAESGYNPYQHFQRSKLVNLHSDDMDWQRLSRIRDGVNMPTAVQNVSASEAFFYGFAPETIDMKGKKAFLKPIVQVQPFVIAWNNVDTSRYGHDFAARKRLMLDEQIIALGAEFGSRSFYGSMQWGLSTLEAIKYAGSSESSSGHFAFWTPEFWTDYQTSPQEAYLSWAWDSASFAAGRFKTGIGFGEENLILNGQAVWYDNAQFSWWSEKFKFFTMIGTSSSKLSDTEWAVQQESWEGDGDATVADGATIPFKMFTYHRFEWKPFSWLGLGVTEMQLVGGKVPDLTNILPTIIWHNTYTDAVSNVMLQLDAWSVPIKGLFVYGEFLIDDVRLFSESSGSKPTSLAWELGALYALPINVPGWIFYVSGEYTHADKWTYTRWQPYLSMYQRQVGTGGGFFLDTPLGHSEGGDVDTFGISVGAVTDKGARFSLGYKCIIKGPVYINDIKTINGEYVPVYYDQTDKIGDLGPDKYSHCFLIEGAWPFLKYFELSASVDLRYVINASHVEGKQAFETIFKAGLKFEI